MYSNKNYKALAATLLAAMAAGSAPLSHAATYFWDNDGATAGFGNATASGNWGAPTAANWSTDTTGGTAPGSITTTTADSVNFGNGATGLGNGTITVGTASAGNITFASGSGAIVLSGGTLTLAAAETITVNNSSATISSTLGTGSMSATGLTAGTFGLTKAGTGTLFLTGTKPSGFAGTTNITGGTLDLGTINGTFGAAVTVTGGTATNSIVGANAVFVQGNGLLTTGLSANQGGFGARGGDLTVNVGGAGASISLNSGGSGGVGAMRFGSATSDSRVILQNSINLNGTGTRDITVNPGTGTASAEISGAITGGSMGFVKKGTGLLVLSGANTFGGEASSLRMIEIQGGTVQVGNGTNNGVIPNATNRDIFINSATAGLAYNVGSGSRTQDNLIRGTGSLTQNSSGGTLTLTNNNTYSGATSITAGTLLLSGTGTVNGSSGITINGSGAKFIQTSSVASTRAITLTQGTVDGTGTVGAVTVGNGTGGIVQNGNGAASGVLTLSSLSFNGAGTLNVLESAATAASARIVVSGALATTPANGQVTVTGSGTWANGANNLLSYGSFGGSASDFTLGSITGLTSRQAAGGLSLASNNLVFTVNGDSPKWTGLDSGNWVVGTTGGSGNWKLITGGGQTDYIQGDNVLFDDSAAGTTTVNVSAANVSPTSTEFNNSTAKSYTLSSTGGFGVAAGSIVKNGNGTLTISSVNTTSAGVQLNAGTLNVNNAGALGSGTLAIAAGTTLDNTSGSAKVATNAQNWNGNFTVTGTNDLTLGTAALSADRQVTVTGGNFTVGGITGVGFGITKAGAGTLAVGASTYTGATTVNGGTLKSTSATAFSNTSSVNLANTAGVALDLNGINQTINTITGGGATGGNIVLNGATLTTGTTANNTFAGALIGASALIKQGTGTWTLTGDKSQFTGNATVNAGALDVGAITTTPFATTATVTLNNNTVLQGSGSLTATLGNGNQIIAGSGGFAARGGNLTVNLFGDGRTINLAGGSNSLGGNFVLGSSTADSRVIIQNGIGINNFSNTRTITVNPGTGTDSAEIAGIVSNGGAGGDSGINKAGTGDLILSAANTITGATTIGAGRIVLGHNQALQFTSLNTDNAGRVGATGFTTPTIGGLTGSTALGTFINSGYSSITSLTLAPQTGRSLSYAGVIADGATGMSVTKTGAGTQTFTATQTYTGGTNVNGGTLALGHATDTLADSGAVNIGGGTLALGSNNDNVGAVTLTSGSITGTGTLSGSSYAVESGSVSAILGGSGALTKSTGGNVTLSGSNTYSGGTNVNAGTLALGHATDTLANSGAVNVAGGTLALGANNDTVGAVTLTSGSITGTGTLTGSSYAVQSGTIAANLGGSGGLTKSTGGTVTLSGNNSYSGATTISGGVLELTGTGSINSSSITVSGGVFKNNSSVALSNPLVFTSGTIGGTNLSGTTVSVGTSQILSPGNSPGTLTTGATTFADGGTYVWEINNATVGGQGTKWDLLVADSLNITAGTSGFTVSLVSLVDPTNIAGNATAFDPNVNSYFLFVDTASAISSFSGTALAVNTSAFSNTFTGTWTIKRGDDVAIGGSDTDLYVAYTAIPEPSAYAVLAGLGALSLAAYRRRKTSSKQKAA